MVKRADGDDVREIVVDLIEVLERGNLAADLPVRADDIIVVPESASASGSYYITGAVNAPGEFKLPVDGAAVLLSQAILRAGGFAKFANRTEVLIIRENPANPDKPERLTVNVRAILDEGRRSEDVELRANDTIRVREVLFAF
jgi:protein involved in polysaccharide export with SLBB domain